MKPDFLVVCAGFAGSVCAERLASAGRRVVIIDRRPHIGGNAFDTYDENGILIHPYGPHIFHTSSKRIFAYLSRFADWRFYEHRVLTEVGGKLPWNWVTRIAMACWIFPDHGGPPMPLSCYMFRFRESSIGMIVRVVLKMKDCSSDMRLWLWESRMCLSLDALPNIVITICTRSWVPHCRKAPLPCHRLNRTCTARSRGSLLGE
jgi:hypothetical protein